MYLHKKNVEDFLVISIIFVDLAILILDIDFTVASSACVEIL